MWNNQFLSHKEQGKEEKYATFGDRKPFVRFVLCKFIKLIFVAEKTFLLSLTVELSSINKI